MSQILKDILFIKKFAIVQVCYNKCKSYNVKDVTTFGHIKEKINIVQTAVDVNQQSL